MTDRDKIPKHWEIKKLGEVLDIQGGSQPAKSNFIYEPKDGYIQLLQIRDFGEKGHPTFVPKKLVTKFCKRDDILIARYGASLGRIVTGHEGAYNVALAKVIDENCVFEKRFIFYLLKTQIFQTPLAMLSRSAQNGFSKGEIAGIELPLPPLHEQQAIVAKIEELLSDLENGKQQLQTALQQLKVYRQSLLKWAFEGKLTNKNVQDGELPVGWRVIELKELVDKISDGPFGSNLKSIDYVSEGIRVIRLENIGEMTFKDEYKTFVTPEKYETIKRHTVSKGDIIFSSFIIDSIRAVILPNHIDMAINKADCFLVRVSETKIDKNYLTYYFSTKAMRNQLVSQIHGATRPRINTTQLKASLIPLPPLSEQHQIVLELESKLTVCDKIAETISQSLQQAETLRQSILKKAFEGKLV
jgi:type I restriction enzyme S subunit